ncbi:MAG TPA: DMT family transporter [Thermomicrobiales bacterium]|nr:DMT family transporter [Thermomicrobiales bacterium]
MLSDRTLTAGWRGLRGAVALPQLLLVLAMFLWGGNFVAGKALASDVAPVTISFWRWSLALLVLLPFSFGSLRRHRILLLAHWRLIAATGATGIAGYSLCLYQSLTSTSAINALLFISTAPLLITLANRLIFHDRGTAWQTIGTLVSSLGAVVVIAHGDATRLLALRLNRGDLWILAGVLIWVTYSVLLRQRPAALPTLPFFTASVAAGVLQMVPLVAWQFARGERLEITAPTVAGLLYVAVGVSAVGYACWTRAIAALGPERAGTFLHLIPIFGTLMATIFLGERLAPYHLVGAALVAGGLRLAHVRYAPVVPVAHTPQRQQARRRA